VRVGAIAGVPACEYTGSNLPIAADDDEAARSPTPAPSRGGEYM
jgi:hypothetical protein